MKRLSLIVQYTWVNLPYLEVWKSGHRTADLGSLSHTFFRGLKLPTLAVWRPRSQTADLGSLMAGFQHFGAFGPQTADLGSFTAAFQPFAQSMMRCMFSNCRPWQFHGRFSALWPQTADLGSFMAGFQHCGSFGSQTADLGSSMAAFQPLSKVAMKLPTLAVSWPVLTTIDFATIWLNDLQYLLTFLPAKLLIYKSAHLPTNLATCQPACLTTCLLA